MELRDGQVSICCQIDYDSINNKVNLFYTMKQINMHTCRWNKIKIHSYDTLEVYDWSRCQNKLSKKFEEFCSLNSVFSYDIPDIITRQEVTVVQTCSSNSRLCFFIS